MPPDVLNPADTVAAPETPAVIEPKDQHYSDIIRTWTEGQRQHWAMTGEEPEAAIDPKAKPATTDLSTAPAVKPETKPSQIKPDEGPGDEDQEPEYYGTPDQQKAQRHAFARLKREKAELRAENRLLREQRTEKPAVSVAAPAPEPKPEPKLERPKRPHVSDAKYDVPNGIKLYDDDFDAYETAKYEFDRQEYARETARTASETQRRSQAETWVGEIAAAKAAHADFEAVAFNSSIPASLPMLGVIMAMKGGAEIFYHLGQNPDVAAELTADTDIPGSYQTYEALAAAAEKDPRLARQLGSAEALVKAAVKQIQSGKTGKVQVPAPKPVTRTNAPAPGARVSSTSQATGDPAQDAYNRGEFALGAKLEAAAEVERYKRH